MNWKNYKFRCSSLGKIMTDARAKKDILSETCKDELNAILLRTKDREKDIMSKYTIKGNLVEENSISLVSSVRGRFLVKNEERFENEYIAGTPDLINPVEDIKSSWDLQTYAKACVTKDNYWQILGYMWLLGDKQGKLLYCLVNTPEELVEDELRRLSWKMNMIDTENERYVEASQKLMKNMIFDDIPADQRLTEFTVEFDDGKIELLKQRIDVCREYLASEDFRKQLNSDKYAISVTGGLKF